MGACLTASNAALVHRKRAPEGSVSSTNLRGYSTLQFLNDYLVPLESFVCTAPDKEDMESQEELANELLEYHNGRLAFYKAQQEHQGYRDIDVILGSFVLPKKPEPPFKAFCKLRLAVADIEYAEGSCIDFRDEAAALEVRLFGAVLVPRLAEWANAPCHNEAKALKITAGEDDEEPLAVGVQVWCMMRSFRINDGGVGDGDGEEEDDEEREEVAGRGIVIEVKHCVCKTREGGGDPMVESWLPVHDVMHCVQLVLNRKLEAAWQDHAQQEDAHTPGGRLRSGNYESTSDSSED